LKEAVFEQKLKAFPKKKLGEPCSGNEPGTKPGRPNSALQCGLEKKMKLTGGAHVLVTDLKQRGIFGSRPSD
jgi:hypothetical protein